MQESDRGALAAFGVGKWCAFAYQFQLVGVRIFLAEFQPRNVDLLGYCALSTEPVKSSFAKAIRDYMSR